jgi:hypothetical protein
LLRIFVVHAGLGERNLGDCLDHFPGNADDKSAWTVQSATRKGAKAAREPLLLV